RAGGKGDGGGYHEQAETKHRVPQSGRPRRDGMDRQSSTLTTPPPVSKRPQDPAKSGSARALHAERMSRNCQPPPISRNSRWRTTLIGRSVVSSTSVRRSATCAVTS